MFIPQSNDVNKLIEFPFRVAQGCKNAKQIANLFGFSSRQSHYYREAAENLGLIYFNKSAKQYELSQKGKEFVELPANQRNKVFAKLLMELPIIKLIMSELNVRKCLSMQDIITIINDNSNLSRETASRRANSLRSWFWWIYAATGWVKVGKNNIYIE